MPIVSAALAPSSAMMSVSMRARAQRVDRDAERPDLVGARLRQPVDGVLGGDVDRDTRLAALALDRADVDDPARLLRDHVLQRAPRAPERRPQVPAQRVVERLVGEVDDGAWLLAAAGVVDHDVDAPELLDGRVDDPLAVLALTLASPATKIDRVASLHLLRAACWPFSSLRPLMTTLAPSRTNASAMARPMPLVPPVTAATFPSNSIDGAPFLDLLEPNTSSSKSRLTVDAGPSDTRCDRLPGRSSSPSRRSAGSGRRSPRRRRRRRAPRRST